MSTNEMIANCSIIFLCCVKKTEKAIAVEGGTMIVMIIETVGRQDATIHLVMKEGLEEIGLTLLMEEAQREGQREGQREDMNTVARDDLFHPLDRGIPTIYLLI